MGFNAFTGEDEAQHGNCPICGSETIIVPVDEGLNRNHMKCTSCDWGYISR